jgi:Glycosyl hydrolase 108
MSASNRLPSFLATMIWEGGARLSLLRSDPGNWTGNRVGIGELKGTKWGVAAGSHPTLKIAALTAAQACEIFVEQYWKPIGGDTLPTGFDHCVGDDSHNVGPGAAAKRLRRVNLLRLNDPAANIHAYSKVRLAFLVALKTWKLFGAGWARRVAGVEAESLRMAYNAQSAPPAAIPIPPRPSASAPSPAPLYPTPPDVPTRRRAPPISADTIAEEAANAEASKASARNGAASSASAGGVGSALAPAAHVHWVIWGICGGVALIAIASSLWRWRAHGARAAALTRLVSELRGTSHVRP